MFLNRRCGKFAICIAFFTPFLRFSPHGAILGAILMDKCGISYTSTKNFCDGFPFSLPRQCDFRSLLRVYASFVTATASTAVRDFHRNSRKLPRSLPRPQPVRRRLSQFRHCIFMHSRSQLMHPSPPPCPAPFRAHDPSCPVKFDRRTFSHFAHDLHMLLLQYLRDTTHDIHTLLPCQVCVTDFFAFRSRSSHVATAIFTRYYSRSSRDTTALFACYYPVKHV